MDMYEPMTEFENIYQAYRSTAKGKHDKNEVVRYENNLHMQLWWLKERMDKEAFVIGGYHKFMIYDPKERQIQALSFSDRVFQHLLCDNVLKPYFEPRLIYDNAACREGKGTHFAMKRFEENLRAFYKKHGNQGYLLKFDIHKYFDSIDHEVLKKKLEKISDKKVLKLLHKVIDSYENEAGKGLPMGNQSSQWFALYYLDRLDRVIKEKLRIKYYVRYMDDGIIIHEDKEFLKQCLKVMEEQLLKDRLEFNQKTQIFPISQGADFLGFRYYLTDSGKVIKKLRTSNKKRFKRRMKNFQKFYSEGKITFEEITRSVSSYNGHLKHGHTWKLRKHVYGKTVFIRGAISSSTDKIDDKQKGGNLYEAEKNSKKEFEYASGNCPGSVGTGAG